MIRAFTVGIVLAATVAAVVSAQSSRPAEPGTVATDPVIAELKALRAELAETAALGVRTQVLVGRLQLQETRIHSLDRQLAETREQRAQAAQTRTAMTAPLKMLGQDAGAPPAQEDAEAASIFAPLKQLAASQQAREEELGEREASLAAQLAAEQARWVEFSRQLDEIDRKLATRGAR